MPARKNSPREIMAHIGQKIRERRIVLGITQAELGKRIGVTYQQAHKYELAINNITAAHLYHIAQVLSAPVSYFFEGLGEKQLAMRERRTLDLVRDFNAIPNEKHQDALATFARMLAETTTRGESSSKLSAAE